MATTHVIFVFFFLLAIAQAGNSDLRPSLTQLPLMSVNNDARSNNKPSISWIENILEAQLTDAARVSYLSRSLVGGPKATVPIAPSRAIARNPTYIVQALIGSPPKKMHMAIDTSHSVSFVPCNDCPTCPNLGNYYYVRKPSNTVNCSNRPLCSKVSTATCGRKKDDPCSFSFTYSMSTIWANLVQDTIVLGKNTAIPRYIFGCMYKVRGTTYPVQGMLGLGPQSLSLLSQTNATFNSKFSYCLPGPTSGRFKGTLKLGDEIKLYKNMKTTPMVVNPKFSSYIVKLTGIMVNGRRLRNISLSNDRQIGKGGTIFDSGTVYSVLVESAYNALTEEIRRLMTERRSTDMKTLGGFDTCYKGLMKSVKNITLIFPGMNLNLFKDSFLIRSKKKNITCLAMSATPVSGIINVIGSYQQQNRRVLFDIPNSKLGVVPEPCS